MALQNEGVYLRVRNPSLSGKYHIIFNLEHCIKNPLNSDFVCVKTDTYECEYDLDGGNVFEQCYHAVREQKPDAAFIDC